MVRLYTLIAEVYPMRYLRTALLLGIALFLTIACSPPQKTSTNAEVALRQAMLNWAILDQHPEGIGSRFPDGHLLSHYGTIVILDDASAANRALSLPGRQVVVLRSEDIRRRADREGDFIYLRFERVDIGDEEATLRLSLAWALSRATQESGRAPLNYGGAEVRFQREGDAWLASEILAAWRS